MKKVFLFTLLFSAYFCSAQNYQCLQSGVKHYFINGNGYLRGIRIDSVKTYADSVVYYPFHTPRGSYNFPPPAPVLDPNGGSWLGKKVLALNDGTFIFDSYWNDSVIIKTQANIGDTWTFYSDTSSLWYKATIIGIDTMTILGTVDSIKKILVTAQNPSGIVTSDPLDSFQIFLSKNNGFVQVFDLYTFPYHKPDSIYRGGLDFYLDRSTCAYSIINSTYGGSPPNAAVTLFRLVDFINPNEQQLYNWNVGDIIKSDHEEGDPYHGPLITQLMDSVTDKVISGHNINFTISGSSPSCYSFYPCAVICKAGGYSFSDIIFPISDTLQMPEETNNHGNYVFYYPYDTNYCLQSPAYILVPQRYYPWGLGWIIADVTYKLGIGKTKFHYADGEPTYETDNLLAYNIDGINCGLPDKVNNISLMPNQLQLYPNPATTSITITSTEKINQITINNLIGQMLYNHEYNIEKVQVDVASLPNGIYFVKINGSEVRKFVKE